MQSVYLVSMGCFKNLVDTERMAGCLSERGLEISSSPDDADICVINTCGFIEDAVKENIEVLLDAAGSRSQGGFSKVIAVGCLVSRYGADVLAHDMPEIDAWIMPEDYAALAEAVDASGRITADRRPRRVRTPESQRHVRYLKITEGCSNRCTYCTIPSIRGDARSLSVSDVVAEAELLIKDGAKEICLVGQDLTSYGEVRTSSLLELLDALEPSLPSDVWVRMLYLHPRGVTRQLIERAASSARILPYLDIPIQHASENVLASMNRSMSRDDLLNVFKTARDVRDDFALRTTVMLGFPGESREDFVSLMKFLDEVQFDRVGAFAFSPEEGTPAAEMPHQVPKRTKQRRLARLMERQEMISASRNEMFVGRTLDVIVDSLDDGAVIGRSFRAAPEVDGVVEIDVCGAEVRPGDIVRAEITDAFEHDMAARMVNGA